MWIGLGTPLTPTNREVRSVERPFLFKIILFQLYHNDFIYTFLVRLIPTLLIYKKPWWKVGFKFERESLNLILF